MLNEIQSEPALEWAPSALTRPSSWVDGVALHPDAASGAWVSGHGHHLRPRWRRMPDAATGPPTPSTIERRSTEEELAAAPVLLGWNRTGGCKASERVAVEA